MLDLRSPWSLTGSEGEGKASQAPTEPFSSHDAVRNFFSPCYSASLNASKLIRRLAEMLMWADHISMSRMFCLPFPAMVSAPSWPQPLGLGKDEPLGLSVPFVLLTVTSPSGPSV